jgi:hypothetical protein
MMGVLLRVLDEGGVGIAILTDPPEGRCCLECHRAQRCLAMVWLRSSPTRGVSAACRGTQAVNVSGL